MAFDYIKSVCEGIKNDFQNSSYPELCTFYIVEEKFIEMQDGIKLQTVIFRPDKEPLSYPTILQRTCYPHNEPMCRIYGENLAKRGYAYVYQFCRGQAQSEGIWQPNIHEREDGIDTIDWLNSQKWVDNIGVWGSSYGSMIGWAMADAVEGKVTSMCLEHYGTDRFVSAYEKGCFRQDILTSWTMENAGFPIEADYLESCKYMPQVEVDEKLWGGRIDWYRDYIQNTYVEDEYWQQGWWKQLREIPQKVTIPLYIISGWYDHHHGSTMKTWERLSEEAKSKSWLEIGGWNHFFMPAMQGKTIEHIENSEVIKMLDWFELTLKQKKTPKKRIRTYTIGEDSWMEYPSWEQLPRVEQRFYLEAGNSGEQEPTGKLKQVPEDKHTEFSYDYDPKDPVMTHGGEALLKSLMQLGGSILQPEAVSRQDVISFVSEPLDEPLSINGKIQADLYVQTNCEDTAFTAKIIEVTAEGNAYNVRTSITTMAHDRELGAAYVPETATKVIIDMWDIVYTLAKGSKLRVDISSSDFPQYNIHSNYAGGWAMQDKTQVVHQTILCGKEYPSVLKIPTL